MGKTEAATFAAGCFWGVEEAFRKLPGVLATEAGYTGGSAEAPTYGQVCTGKTGHAEAVRVEFDPAKITYHKLLEFFFSIHDPTSRNRQGPDIGEQYRSAVFFHGKAQEKEARGMVAALGKAGRLSRPIATQIEPAGKFWRAEEHHQKYIMKKGGSAGCHI
ncbi:MAG: peptide-methionine (S)-S-oxide reductase MsrA [Candidatus Micrarchaeia archaeon]|jgi:peptide-methionine (S)-S-oxide reductase